MHKYNFSPGPSKVPRSVMERVHAEWFDWQGQGVSVVELSHRSERFETFVDESRERLQTLLNIPDTHTILHLSGGARAQFAMLPMNLFGKTASADYVDCGFWSRYAAREASRYGDIQMIEKSDPARLLDFDKWSIRDNAAYAYFTGCESIDGLEYFADPPTDISTPILCDMTANFLSRPIDIARYGAVFASTQKNIGIAGLSVVIIRKDLLNQALRTTPACFHYRTQDAAQCLYMTPPVFAWYVSDLVVQWLIEQGGLAEMAERNRRQAARVYAVIDTDDFYQNTISPAYRSRMTLPFHLINAALQDRFLSEADAEGFIGLKGHSIVGGCRACLYNAIEEEEITALCDFLIDFRSKYG